MGGKWQSGINEGDRGGGGGHSERERRPFTSPRRRSDLGIAAEIDPEIDVKARRRPPPPLHRRKARMDLGRRPRWVPEGGREGGKDRMRMRKMAMQNKAQAN